MSRSTLVRAGVVAAMIGGTLRAATSFPLPGASDAILQVIYIVVDFFLLTGILGFYLLCHEELGRTGAVGFLLALVGMLLIRSSRAIPGVNLYPPGALIFVLGISTLCVAAWIAKRLRGWIPGSLTASIVAGALSEIVAGGGWLFVVSGVMFGAAVVGIGRATWRGGPERPALP